MERKCKNCAHCASIEHPGSDDITYVCLSGDSKFLFNKLDPEAENECFECENSSI